jgi:hypothetical protein
MALRLDLMLLESPRRFQDMCFRLARKRFPNAVPVNFASWDRGCDIIEFATPRGRGDVIWQCKFTSDLGSTTRRAIQSSLESLDKHCTTKTSRGKQTRRKVARGSSCRAPVAEGGRPQKPQQVPAPPNASRNRRHKKLWILLSAPALQVERQVPNVADG